MCVCHAAGHNYVRQPGRENKDEDVKKGNIEDGIEIYGRNR